MFDDWGGGRGGGFAGIDRFLFCGSSQLFEYNYLDKVLNLNQICDWFKSCEKECSSGSSTHSEPSYEGMNVQMGIYATFGHHVTSSHKSRDAC